MLALRANFLPIMTLTITAVAGIRGTCARPPRRLAQDYIRLARAKGCPATVLRRHLFRNAACPWSPSSACHPALLGGTWW